MFWKFMRVWRLGWCCWLSGSHAPFAVMRAAPRFLVLGPAELPVGKASIAVVTLSVRAGEVFVGTTPLLLGF
jgi:hypothetical protein